MSFLSVVVSALAGSFSTELECPEIAGAIQVAMAKGRVALTTNMVIGGTVKDDSGDEWLNLDQKGQVTQKISSRGKYVSVKIGPIRVVSSEQVQAVYRAMRRDNRMKYFL
ncbi:hypothetical protein ACQ4PT_024877 [Festuca glaucescens]